MIFFWRKVLVQTVALIGRVLLPLATGRTAFPLDESEQNSHLYHKHIIFWWGQSKYAPVTAAAVNRLISMNMRASLPHVL